MDGDQDLEEINMRLQVATLSIFGQAPYKRASVLWLGIFLAR